MNPFTVFVALIALAGLVIATAALHVALGARERQQLQRVAIDALAKRAGRHDNQLELLGRELGMRRAVPEDARITTAMRRPEELRAEPATPIAAAAPAEEPPETRREGSGQRRLPSAVENAEEGWDDDGETRVASRPELRAQGAQDS